MNVRELRLGNLVRYHDMTTVDIEVDIEDLILIKEQLDGCTYSPIPINEEWLHRCGFLVIYTKTAHENSIVINPVKDYENGNIVIHHNPSKDTYELYLSRLLREGTPIKYVHQLQNLYFALTGEELEIKAVESELK